MHDLEAKLSFREALVAPVVVEPKIARVDHRIGPHGGSKLVDDPELAVGVADQ